MSRNPVKWFEIMGKDAIALQTFYRDVFGWELTPPVKDMGNYSMLGPEVDGIPGGIGEQQSGEPRVSIYMAVDDPDAFLEKIERAGGKTLMPTTTITENTTIAMFEDPAGNTMGLMKASPTAERAEDRERQEARGG